MVILTMKLMAVNKTLMYIYFLIRLFGKKFNILTRRCHQGNIVELNYPACVLF